MANQDVRVSALQSASTLSTDDLALATVVDELSETGYTSKKITEGAKAAQYLEAFTFANLNTNAKTIVGAINEAATTGGSGDFPMHIHNSTITETAGEVLDAMADGLKPYVIWTNNSQSNYTFTYVLVAVWNPDATTETLIFGCPITGAVRTIHVYINPTTRTYSSSISVVDYNIPQINDSSTSSSAVWSAQKINSELADKAEIDDTAVSSSTAWSSERIVSLLPTESASGAVASFETPLTLPLVSHVVTIEPVQAGTGDPSPSNVRPISGWSAVTISHSGADTSEAEEVEIPLGQTVYRGQINVTTGVLTITDVLIETNGADSVGTAGFGTYPYIVIQGEKKYKNVNAQIMNNLSTNGTMVSNYILRLTNGITGVTNNTEFLAVLSQTKLQALCPLIDPIKIQLTPTQINTLLGVNNIWADTGDTAVEFKQDIQTYIDSRLSSGTRSLSLAKAPVETEETKQEEQEGGNNER